MSQTRQTMMYSNSRKVDAEKLKREFLNISVPDDTETINSSQHNSFIGTYNRLQKRSEIERQRSKSGEKISNYSNVGTAATVGEGVSSATTTIVSKKVNSLPSTTTTNSYYTYSKKQGEGKGECVLIVNKEEGWFKLETGSLSQEGNVTRVHKIIQIDSNQSASSSGGENYLEKLKK